MRLRRLSAGWISGGVATAILTPLVVLAVRPYVAHLRYQPREGDIVFQSLPYAPLVNAIEAATDSPFSHCGLVARRGGQWVVIEAYRGVEETPLLTWLARGRDGAFAAYRLQPQYERDTPAIIEQARGMLGRPYDARYRWDDEQIY